MEPRLKQISRSWVSSRTSTPEVVKRRAGGRLLALIESMQQGDELRRFESPLALWQARRGRRGYVLLRNGEIVDGVVTALN
jgi:hypothetical protein